MLSRGLSRTFVRALVPETFLIVLLLPITGGKREVAESSFYEAEESSAVSLQTNDADFISLNATSSVKGTIQPHLSERDELSKEERLIREESSIFSWGTNDADFIGANSNSNVTVSIEPHLSRGRKLSKHGRLNRVGISVGDERSSSVGSSGRVGNDTAFSTSFSSNAKSNLIHYLIHLFFPHPSPSGANFTSANSSSSPHVLSHVSAQAMIETIYHRLALQLSTSDFISSLVSLCLWILVALALLWWCRKVKLHLRFREIIPGVDKFLFQIGVDSHMKFECKMLIHEVTYAEDLKTYVMVQAAYNQELTCLCKMGPSQSNKGMLAAGFHDAICIDVPQGCTEIKFKLIGNDRKSVLAEGTASVEKIIELDDDSLAIMMLRKGKGRKVLHDDPRCLISCFCGDDTLDGGGDSDSEQSSPQAKVLLSGLDTGVFSLEFQLEIQKNSRNRAKEWELTGSDFSDMEIYQHQLEVVAKTCQGRLVYASGWWSNQKQFFFSVYRDETTGSFLTGWKLGWWDRSDKPTDPQKTPPKDTIPVLYIGKVYPDANKPDELTLEYVKNSKDLEASRMHLIRVDRSRDLWVEGLSVFIDYLRKVRSAVKDSDKPDKKEKKKAKSQQMKALKALRSNDESIEGTTEDNQPESHDHSGDEAGGHHSKHKHKHRSKHHNKDGDEDEE